MAVARLLPPRSSIIVCPFYFCADPQRREITRRIFRNLEGLTLIGLGSEEALSRDLFIESHPARRYREYPQYFPTPGGGGSIGLRLKMNAAIQAARKWQPDTVFITGSDDLVPRDFFTHSEADLVGIGGGSLLWRYGTEDYRWLPYAAKPGFELCGGPLGFSRRFLDLVDWTPYILPGCEEGAERLVRMLGGTVEARPHTFCQVKSDAVLNHWGEFEGSGWTTAPAVEVVRFRKRWQELAR